MARTELVYISLEDSKIFYWNYSSTMLINLFNFSSEKWVPDSHWIGVL